MGRLVFLPILTALFLFTVIQGASMTYNAWDDNDLSHYYTSSLLLINGVDPYLVEDADKAQREAGFSPRHIIRTFTNPPALLALFVPMVLLNPAGAFVVWNIIQLVCLAGIWVMLDRIFPLSIKRADKHLLFVTLLLSPVTFMHIRFNQTQLLIVALLLVGFFEHRNNRHFFGGLLVGLATSLKIFTWPVLFYSIVKGGKKGFAGSAIGVAALSLVPAFVVGPEIYRHFLLKALPYVLSSSSDFQSNISLSQILVSTGNYLGFEAFGYMDYVRFGLGILQIALILTLSIHLAGLRKREELTEFKYFSLFLLISLLFAPSVWPHYLHLSLPAIWCFAFVKLSEKSSPIFCVVLSVLLYSTTGGLPGLSDGANLCLAWWGIVLQFSLLWLVWRQSTDIPNSITKRFQ